MKEKELNKSEAEIVNQLKMMLASYQTLPEGKSRINKFINNERQKINNIPTIEEIKEVLSSCYFNKYRLPEALIVKALIEFNREKYQNENRYGLLAHIKSLIRGRNSNLELKNLIKKNTHVNRIKAGTAAFNILKEKITQKGYTPNLKSSEIWDKIQKDIECFADHVDWLVLSAELVLHRDSFELFSLRSDLSYERMCRLKKLVNNAT